MSELIMERIKDNMNRLKLMSALEQVGPVEQAAKAGAWSYLNFLDRLLETEVTAKEKRRVETTMKIAGLPSTKTVDEYDFTFHQHLDKRQVLRLFDLDFVCRQENVILLGPPGVGKTHLAVALAIKACVHGYSIHFMTMAELIGKMEKDEAAGKSNRGRAYIRNALVVVDEVGYMPVTAAQAHLFFRFVASRYERASTIITSNKVFSEWSEFLGDPVITSAILDRLLHHCSVIQIKGNSYRMKSYQERFKEKNTGAGEQGGGAASDNDKKNAS